MCRTSVGNAMKLFYVILTCQKYLPTRCDWVRNSWLRQIKQQDDYCFLSSIPDPQSKVVGWNTPDNYEGCSRKYLEFFRNMNVDADWVVFVDDDTFIFPERLRIMLRKRNPADKLYIGKLLDGEIPTMSGGAGFVLSSRLFSEMQNYVKTNDIVLDSTYSDVTIGQWAKALSAEYVWDKRFNSHPHTEEGDINTAISFHYVTQPLFRQYSKISAINLSILNLLYGSE